MSRRSRQILAVALCALSALVAVSLACTQSNMQAKDQPVWMCPTATLDPNCFVTTTPGTPPPIAGSCGFQAPIIMHDDFYLGDLVIVGGVGGTGIGIWVVMDNLRVDGPFDYTYPIASAATPPYYTRKVWVASWDVSVTNGSLTNDYEFYPQFQLYVIDALDEQGNEIRNAWPVSADAHQLIGLDPLILDDAHTFLPHGNPQPPQPPLSFTPGGGMNVRVAAIIPTNRARRLAYILDPTDTEKVDQMLRENALGSNVAHWINQHNNVCPYDDILPQSGQFSGYVPGGPAQPGQYVPGYLLARHPLSAYHIVRGFGCAVEWTGFKSSACPGAGWFHNGVDYGAVKGTTYYDTLPVSASIDYAGPDDAPDCSATTGSEEPHFGYGNFVRQVATEQGHSLTIWAGHLSAISVGSPGDSQPGQVLGAVGSTGCSTGPHLHFAVRLDGRFVDPEALIPPGQ